MKITVGTRGSLLAVEQARPMVDFLKSRNVDVVWREFTTHGDKWLAGPLEKAGHTGLFTKELEESLLAEEVDLLIHSLKDVALERPAGIVTACIPERANPLDLLILRPGSPANPTIGTSSIRRERILKELMPTATFTWIRGNVPTRIQRVREGVMREAPVHGTLLAAAGVERLQAAIQGGAAQKAVNMDLSDLQVRILTPEELLPAPGQGALLAETRSNRPEILDLLLEYHHQPTAQCVTLERGVLAAIGGGCQQPLGAYATHEPDGSLRLRVAYAGQRGVIKWEGAGRDPQALLEACRLHLIAQDGPDTCIH